MNKQLLSDVMAAVKGLDAIDKSKTAFVPGPSVQGQLQRLQAIAAEQQSDGQAAQQATEQIQAQAQGAPPAMRIEDLAGIIEQAAQGLAQLISGLPAQITQMVMQAQQAQQAQAAPAAGGDGQPKKPKKEDVMVQKLDEMITLLRSATGAPPPAPPGAMGAPVDPAAAGAPPPGAPPPGAPPADPSQQQVPQ